MSRLNNPISVFNAQTQTALILALVWNKSRDLFLTSVWQSRSKLKGPLTVFLTADEDSSNRSSWMLGCVFITLKKLDKVSFNGFPNLYHLTSRSSDLKERDLGNTFPKTNHLKWVLSISSIGEQLNESHDERWPSVHVSYITTPAYYIL